MKKYSTVAMVCIGAILGTVVGVLFQQQFPLLRLSQPIGFPPTTFELSAFKLTLGLTLRLNAGSVLGGILGWYAHKRM